MPPAGDLASLREAIEEVDRDILVQLRRRLDLVEQVLAAKLAAGSPLRDREREQQVLAQVRQAAVDHGLDPGDVERLYRVLFEISLAHQERRAPGGRGPFYS